MFKRYRMLAVALLMVLAILPAAAAEPVSQLPATKGYTSSRFEMLETMDDMPLFVGRGEMENQNRVYYVLKTVDGSDETLEIVIYDGTLYSRSNDEAQWYIEVADLPLAPPSSEDTPAVDAGDIPVSKIGSTVIAGVPTDQYQIWLNMPELSGYMKYDLWIGQAINYVYQSRAEVYFNDEDLGAFSLASLARSYDFNAAIKVYPPQNAIPRPDDEMPFSSVSSSHTSVNVLIAPWATAPFRDRVAAMVNR